MSPGGDFQPPNDGLRDPQRVGSFEIVDELGRGGMGVVYRARDLKLEREVALKRPLPNFVVDPVFYSKFMTEARTASKLMHPNITTVFEVFEEDDTPWLVMELIEGESLRSLLKERVPLPFEDVLHHAEGLTDALRTAHMEGVLHRDVNPNNILVGRDGRARLTDFGLARVWDASGSSPSEATTRAHSRDAAGTRGYMSPEQVLGKKVDPRSDLFSLGAVLYEMATGRPAFARGSDENWIEALLHQEPEPISRLNQDVPIEFQNIVRKALAKRPFQRHQSASEMLQEIRALRRRMQSDWSQSWHGYSRRPDRRRKMLTAGVLVAAVAAAGAATAWLLTRNSVPTLIGTHRQLTTASGWEGQPALSPDGTMVAYTSDSSGNADIWVSHIAGGDPLQRTRHPGADTDPAWFPDGGALAFVSDRSGVPSVWRVPVLGGTPTRLLANAEQPAVSPDGSRIAFITPDTAGLKRIALAPLADLTQIEIVTDDDGGLWDHHNPAWSPDGTTLCYADQRHLWLVPAAGGTATRLTSHDEADIEPTWTSDGRRIVFASFREGSIALWTIPVAGGEAQRLTAGTSSESSPSISRDTPLLAYCTRDANPNVVVMDRSTGQRLLLPGSRRENLPSLAPDGSAVVFQSDRSGGSDLWLQPLDGLAAAGLPHRLTDHPGTVALSDVSADARWVAYGRVVEEQRDIWIVPTDGGPPIRFTEDAAADYHPAFSPDGSQLAWVSDRGGVENVWLAGVSDGRRVGPPRRLSHGESADVFPCWSADGRQLAWVEATGYASEVLVTDLETEAPPRRVTDGAGARQVRWAGSANELLVSGTWGGDQLEVRTVSLADGGARPLEPPLLLGPHDETNSGWFTVGKGGQLIAYDTIEQRGDVWLAELSTARR